MTITARPAQHEDAAEIAAIYNQGIEDRIGTFETEPRTVADIEGWFEHAKAFVAVENAAGEVVGYAVAHPYADRCCYAGIGEFSVYVGREQRGLGVGRVAMAALAEAKLSFPSASMTSRGACSGVRVLGLIGDRAVVGRAQR